MRRLLFLLLFLPIDLTGTEPQIVKQMSEDPDTYPFAQGELEYKLWDNSRIDILNNTYAIEVDHSYKWAEAIGQSLYYSDVTGKDPGIILLVKDKKKESQFIYRCQTVANKRDIKIWIVEINSE